MESTVFAATYTLIYSFLTKQSHLKAAQALKKAAKDVVVLGEEVDAEGPQLDIIIEEWRQFHAKKSTRSGDHMYVAPLPHTSWLMVQKSESSAESDSDCALHAIFTLLILTSQISSIIGF